MAALELPVARVLLDSDRLESGGLTVEGGRIAALGCAARTPFDRWIAVPGMRNAHVHLDLSLVRGVPRADRGFAAWILDLLNARGPFDPAFLQRGADAGAREVLACGTTAVGDIDSSGAAAAVVASAGLRGVSFLEVLGTRDPEARLRTAEDWIRGFGGFAPSPSLRAGISPHAPYSTPAVLYRGAARVASDAQVPLTTHVAETLAERRFLEHGDGEFQDLLARLGMPSPRAGEGPTTPVRLLAETGCLGPRALLAHVNYPDDEEIALLAASGATAVYCPRSHRFFGHAPHPIRRLFDAGIPVALGTDSRASNADLDLRQEMAFLRAARPDLPPARIWDMATSVGARILEGGSGTLDVGQSADLAILDLGGIPRTAADAVDRLTSGLGRVVATLVCGTFRHLSEDAAPDLLPLTHRV